MKSYAVALSLVFGAGVAQADGFAYVSSFGDKYTASRNADDLTLSQGVVR